MNKEKLGNILYAIFVIAVVAFWVKRDSDQNAIIRQLEQQTGCEYRTSSLNFKQIFMMCEKTGIEIINLK